MASVTIKTGGGSVVICTGKAGGVFTKGTAPRFVVKG